MSTNRRARLAPLLATALAAATAGELLASRAHAPGQQPAGSRATLSAADRLDEEQLREAVRLAGGSLADLEAGNYGRSEQALLELARLLPDNLLPRVNLAIVYFQLGRRDDALAAIERARAIAPESTEALYTLARILMRASAEDPALRPRFERALDELERVAPRDPRPHWLRASALLEAGRFGEALAPLQAAIERSRENLVLLVETLAASARAGEVDRASDALDAVEDRLNGFDDRAQRFADRARDAILDGDAAGLRPAALTLQNLLRPTALYQVGRAELEGREGGRVLFPQLEFEPPLPKSVQGGQDLEIALVDATADWSFAEAGSVTALEVAREAGPPGDGAAAGVADTLLALLEGGTVRRVVARARVAAPGEDSARATAWPDLPASPRSDSAELLLSYDVDQDERPDLIAAIPEGVFLARGSERTAASAAASAAADWERLAPAGEVTFVLPVDLDHDGDIDLLVGRHDRTLYLQNRGGGGFVDASAELGVASIVAADAVAADLDGDGDLDLALATADGVRLLDNRRSGPLMALPPIAAGEVVSAIAAGDLDGDGRFDLVLGAPAAPGGIRVMLNRPAGWSEATIGSPPSPAGPSTAASNPAQVRDVALIDLDLDGDLDVVALAGSELRWLRNRREAGLAIESAHALAGEGERLVPFDADGDGDLDLAIRLAAGGAQLLRNDGAERNQWLALRLRGLNDSNAKNNTQGLHARIEVRVGTELQTLMGNGGINRIGLGARRQADVLRVVWTNGLAQTWQQLGARQTLVEEQVLKGSCPFLYTWDGDGFSFVTDLMWRSTLGMVFADGSPAPHHSARDWILIPGERLVAAGDELWLQVTDELWETIYVDRQSLLAVDHPAELELVVDETFGPPPFPAEAPLHVVGRRLEPVSAIDHAGANRLDEIAARDRRYVAPLPTTRHQGVTSGHWLAIEFEGVPARGPLDLLLWGWVFPADTTINTALAQDPTRDAATPALEVRRADGSWRTLLPSIGLPLGKDKSMVVALADLLEPGERATGRLELRIASSMEVYWDAAALAPGTEPPPGALRITRLEPSAADLHFRGSSRLIRDSPSSPHRFDYSLVDARPPFPPMAGAHTRYGDVLELLASEDDRTIVMSPGDELTVRYPAGSLPPLPAGWRRDWVLYTDGWVKDADFHTRSSQTVEPLPFHGMSSYPEHAERSPLAARPGISDDLDEYQTRILPEQSAPAGGDRGMRQRLRRPHARRPATSLRH
ncbi:MAG TPA: FG-GAP-like repeat-containing protein [Thermoanaerobaculia bacterium]|nr:FG-GAP-like repeat-containing protein [Thermoanaerobaculia bacterium]